GRGHDRDYPPSPTRRSSDLEEEGVVRVFFELNGQPRTMRVEKAGVPRSVRRPQAQPDDPTQVPAPTPGMIVTVAVKAGQAVRSGDPLVSIEAMQMETQIRAERDAVVRAIHVKPGDTVSAHDLLIEFAPQPGTRSAKSDAGA